MPFIKDFVENSEVLLDLHEDTLESIVDRLLERMFDSEDRENISKLEIKSSIFADDSKTRLKEKLQGIVQREELYDWEQTWVCCPVTIPTLNKRYSLLIYLGLFIL